MSRFSQRKIQGSIKLVSWSITAAIIFELLLNIPTQVTGQSHPPLSAQQSTQLQEAKQLNKQVIELYNAGKYNEAIAPAERAIEISEKVLGKEHPDVATTLNNLAELYKAQGRYQKAEPLHLRSLAIYEKMLGKEHPLVATSLNNLAELYKARGRYEKAEPLYLRSLAIYEKVLGKQHPLVATSLNNLASLYQVQGSYEKAEPLYLRSLEIRERQGKENPDIPNNLNNLASLYQVQGSYEKAEPLYLRSLTIMEKLVGKEHPNIATSLNNLAELYKAEGRYEKAESLYLRSLGIREKALGKEHPDVATSLNTLASLYQEEGNYQKAEPLCLRSLAIREKMLGKQHPLVASSLNNLAQLYQAQNDITRAVDFSSRGLAIEEYNFGFIFTIGSEERKQDYLKTFLFSTYQAISLSLHNANNPTAARLALTTVLRRKVRVLDTVIDSIQILRSHFADKPETQKLFDQWENVNQNLSALIYRGQGNQSVSEYKAQLQQLNIQKERIEEAISNKSAEFHITTQPVELASIQTLIPKDAALVEFVRYQPFNAKAKQAEKSGKLRYAAAVLRSSGEPRWVDLADAETIETSVANLRKALAEKPSDAQTRYSTTTTTQKKPTQSVEQLARTLDRQVMAPIRPLLGDARHLLLSPDGQLAIIPFEVLLDEQNKYLIQRYAFSYLTTGRELLRIKLAPKSFSPPVVFANIDYDQQEITGPSTVRGLRNRPDDQANLQFAPLYNTLDEANKIKEIFPDTKVISGKQATETAIKKLQAPSILHLATHGFFITEKEVADNFNKELLENLKLENPLLRSGLAFAGINNRQRASSNTNDGILTALEVTGLNLRGTQLVVLSACETGLGDLKVGGRLYGLRRALVIAGSQTQVLSLWTIDDEGTKDLMVKYYQNLNAGKGKHDALRQAQLEFLKRPEYRYPYYWASFVASGDWSPLWTGNYGI
ncbi:tetratricopeptide repeat protein [Plectonema radiosum NIES-515]|uniref:Tetratricopeptide repeat protein n=1 Tax=Plectonema radiosum NIES-515 TaxID=2986073 RepID=A0ABT3B249_9CYAN|nr:tetratricopeptide repeat protein [Plectonema radiosum]MCV3215450.1 tetratricopeptide repeat protein [Plectonema radiosum NIES-515]